mmetsp:Transcript_16182/g.32801  ORF Transcript_16182/g.32801 Transcript_16182/m.32801 type:complete len:143 (-) Transcript_16182:1424-1852(-)
MQMLAVFHSLYVQTPGTWESGSLRPEKPHPTTTFSAPSRGQSKSIRWDPPRVFLFRFLGRGDTNLGLDSLTMNLIEGRNRHVCPPTSVRVPYLHWLGRLPGRFLSSEKNQTTLHLGQASRVPSIRMLTRKHGPAYALVKKDR